ncbi:hypothetical protein BKA64DRAFT_263734 [Cadophora sp. MPI-SDFR-AT-0126]|nr:hypothetical protein BKA64DRAFT_263734 [Leotiomycetes sp. MPI-SDFR-AT-0126]
MALSTHQHCSRSTGAHSAQGREREQEGSAERPPSSTASIPARPYQCRQCQQAFSRLDHLSRHVRIHTAEKSYRCAICGTCFSRSDLLKRHGYCHSSDQSQKHKRQKHREDEGRVSQACKQCSTSKLKCEERKPCQRCLQRGLHCQWKSNSNRGESQLRDVDPSGPPCQLSSQAVPDDAKFAITPQTALPSSHSGSSQQQDASLMSFDVSGRLQHQVSQVAVEQPVI